jgi:uncharacterized Zn-binding protein involved in type VI secretion
MGTQLLVEEGSPNISINGKPAARAGDAVSCRLVIGENPVIAEGSASVFFNGRPAARMGDRIEKGGSVSSGSGNVFIGDSGTLVAVGDGIQVVFNDGCGIYLNCPSPADASFKSSLADALAMAETGRQGASALFVGSNDTANNTSQVESGGTQSASTSSNISQCSAEVSLAPPPSPAKEQEDKYEYYVVTAEGLKTELAVFSLTQLLFDFSGVQVTDYFEEGRWMMSEPDLGEKSKAKINAGREAYNRQQLRDQSRAAWKGKYKPAQTVSTETAVPRGLTPAAMVRVGGATGLIIGLSVGQKWTVRKNLLDRIERSHADVKAKMPDNGGVLIEAHYILRQVPGDQTYIAMDGDISILGGYPDYVDEIKKYMTETFIENKYDSATRHEFLFVWAVKK